MVCEKIVDVFESMCGVLTFVLLPLRFHIEVQVDIAIVFLAISSSDDGAAVSDTSRGHLTRGDVKPCLLSWLRH